MLANFFMLLSFLGLVMIFIDLMLMLLGSIKLRQLNKLAQARKNQRQDSKLAHSEKMDYGLN